MSLTESLAVSSPRGVRTQARIVAPLGPLGSSHPGFGPGVAQKQLYGDGPINTFRLVRVFLD